MFDIFRELVGDNFDIDETVVRGSLEDEMEIAADRLNDWLKLVQEIAVGAGDMIKKMAESSPKVMRKGPVDLVTEADLRAEEYIIDRLGRFFPDHSILAEESGGEENSDYLWVIDPIDGTTNYAHGFPVYAVSIGLLSHKEPIAGVVYEPNLKELFSAVKGGGASLNGRPIRVSEVGDLDRALLATGFPYSLRQDPDKIMRDFINLSLVCQGVRRAGAASIDLCSLACGRFDGFWEIGLKPWDTAAAGLIVEEAGGLLTKYGGEPFDPFTPMLAASNGRIHEQILAILQKQD